METEATRELMPFVARNGVESVCRVEIHHGEGGRPVVIVEELDENPGQSVTNDWEHVVDLVCRKYGVPKSEAVWIECYETLESAPAGTARYQFVTQGRDGLRWRNVTEADWRELGLEPRA